MSWPRWRSGRGSARPASGTGSVQPGPGAPVCSAGGRRRSSSTRRARSPSGCGTGPCRPTMTQLRAWLPTWRDDGGDARRFRHGMPARFGEDEVAAWRHCEQVLTPLRPRIRAGGQGAAGVSAASAVPGGGGDRRVACYRTDRYQAGKPSSESRTTSAPARARSPREKDPVATPTGCAPASHRGGHVGRAVAHVGGRAHGAQHRRLLRAVHVAEHRIGVVAVGVLARLDGDRVLGRDDDHTRARGPDRG